MSYSPPNYTDGVPIKISEKYKPPPAVHLPTKITQQLARTEVPVAFEDYNFDLERKIVSKTSEWIHWRARERNERHERIRLREQARLKQLEDEQKHKLNQVSYPSSDEEDEELATEATHSEQIIPTAKPNFNTILMPTQALDPVKSHRRYASNSSNKIDFSFFESDQSPFDHLEMKSMNEMEVLAQVLGSTPKDENLVRNNSSESESSDHQTNNNVDPPEAPHPQPQQQPFVYSNSGYYGTGGVNTYNYVAPPVPVSFMHQNQFLYPHNYAGSYDYQTYNTGVNNNNIENGISEETSKPKSMPSLLQELNDELNNSQRRKKRNNSQNSPKEIVEESKTSPVEDEFSKLSLQTQTLATQMGFKREMVIRVASLVGENDKKLVDHLISLVDLLQMGFEEERVSEALIKFDNNKDQALDFLIS